MPDVIKAEERSGYKTERIPVKAGKWKPRRQAEGRLTRPKRRPRRDGNQRFKRVRKETNQKPQQQSKADPAEKDPKPERRTPQPALRERPGGERTKAGVKNTTTSTKRNSHERGKGSPMNKGEPKAVCENYAKENQQKCREAAPGQPMECQ